MADADGVLVDGSVEVDPLTVSVKKGSAMAARPSGTGYASTLSGASTSLVGPRM
jgi:hypothetical protein